MEIRILTPNDAEKYWELRLQSLKEFPDAFLTTYEESKQKEAPINEMKKRFENKNNYTLGAFEQGQLVGMVTLLRESHDRLKHRANIFAMSVDSSWQGKGIGEALLSEAIKIAKSIEGVEQIHLTVESKNEPAKKLYKKLGFKVYAFEERAMKVGDRYLDEEHMVLFL